MRKNDITERERKIESSAIERYINERNVIRIRFMTSVNIAIVLVLMV